MGLNLFEKPAVVVVDVGFAFNQNRMLSVEWSLRKLCVSFDWTLLNENPNQQAGAISFE